MKRRRKEKINQVLVIGDSMVKHIDRQKIVLDVGTNNLVSEDPEKVAAKMDECDKEV